jgi:hypothetical protein
MLRKIIALFFVASLPGWGAACTLAATAPLSTATWTGSGCTGAFTPGNGDTVIIPNGKTLTVDQNWTIGASGANNTTAAILVNGTGQVEISGGITLRTRGDMLTASPSGSITNAYVLDAGSALIFDSSQAVSPTTTRYREGNVFAAYQGFAANGTSGVHVTITSDNTNGALNGQFRSGDNTVGSNYRACGDPCNLGGLIFVARYTDFSHIGDGNAFGEAFAWNWAAGGGGINDPYTMQHDTFDYVGVNSAYVQAITALLIDSNVFTNSLGTSNMLLWGHATTGTLPVISNNVFDKRFNDGDGGCNGNGAYVGVTFSGNYFANGVCPNPSSTSLAVSDNFMRLVDYMDRVDYTGSVLGDYFFVDAMGADNVHLFGLPVDVTSTATGLIWEVPDDYTTDSGEAVGTWSKTVGHGTVVQNAIEVPSKTGIGTMELSAFTSARPDPTWGPLSLLHNTWPASHSFGMMQMNEGGAALAPVAALESNLAWSTGGTYCKVSTFDGAVPLLNSVTLADYNSADQYVVLNSVSTRCSVTCSNAVCANQGNGYIGDWTSTPGAHDVTAEPYFADPFLRNVAMWDTRYLGHATGTTWQTSTSYTVGQIISDSHTGYWQGQPINFRCIAAHTSGATTEPNVGASWRSDWEFASLADLRSAIPAGTTYTDGAIGCAGCTAIQALVKWVRRGFTPQNPVLWCAGHDGETIGAVPFCASGRVMIGLLAGM